MQEPSIGGAEGSGSVSAWRESPRLAMQPLFRPATSPSSKPHIRLPGQSPAGEPRSARGKASPWGLGNLTASPDAAANPSPAFSTPAPFKELPLTSRCFPSPIQIQNFTSFEVAFSPPLHQRKERGGGEPDPFYSLCKIISFNMTPPPEQQIHLTLGKTCKLSSRGRRKEPPPSSCH